MKSVSIWILIVLSGLSCIRVETISEEDLIKPRIQINIHVLDSENWKRAYLVTSSIRFAEVADDHNGMGYGTLQNWDGLILDFDLSQQKDKVLLEKPYWESTLLGINPNFLGSAFVTKQNEFVDNVFIDYLEYIPFLAPIDIRNGRQYEIDLILDLDEIIEQSASITMLNTREIFARIVER